MNKVALMNTLKEEYVDYEVNKMKIFVGIIKPNNLEYLIYAEMTASSFEKVVKDIEKNMYKIIELPKPIDDIRLIRGKNEPKILVITYSDGQYKGFTQEAYRRLVDSKKSLSEFL